VKQQIAAMPVPQEPVRSSLLSFIMDTPLSPIGSADAGKPLPAADHPILYPL